MVYRRQSESVCKNLPTSCPSVRDFSSYQKNRVCDLSYWLWPLVTILSLPVRNKYLDQNKDVASPQQDGIRGLNFDAPAFFLVAGICN